MTIIIFLDINILETGFKHIPGIMFHKPASTDELTVTHSSKTEKETERQEDYMLGRFTIVVLVTKPTYKMITFSNGENKKY
jgi:hypothetical protein